MDVELVDCKAINPTQLEAWQQLFESEPHARFYHHPHWHQCIAEHLVPEHLQLGFLSVNRQLQMVLPLSGKSGTHHRAHPTHDHLSLNDVLIHPLLVDDGEALLQAINLTLNKAGSGWWDWKVSNVPQHSALIQTLANTNPQLANTDNSLLPVHVQTVRGDKKQKWLLKQSRRSASFDCSSEACPPQGKLKRNLRRLRKQMQACGNIRVENIVDPNLVQEAYDEFLTVEASGWKGTGNDSTAIASNPELKAFYQSLLAPNKLGLSPEINLLWCDDTCAAAQFGIRTGTCLSLLKIGYNEAFARFSPGYLLLETILSEAPERGINTLSLVTSPPWAERWHPDTVPVWQLNHYNNSPFGTALHQFDRLKQAAKIRLKQAA